MKKITTFLYLFALLVKGTWAGNDPSLQLLRDSYKKQYEAWNMAGKRSEIFFMHYSVKTTLSDNGPGRDGKTSSVVTEVKVWMNKDQLHLKSEQVEMYQDKKEAFTILPKQKIIYRSDNIRNLDREKRVNQLSIIRDTLFDLGRVILSENLSGHETGADKKIVLALTEEGKKLFNMKQVTFFLHTAKKEIKRIKIDYNSTPQGGFPNNAESAEFTFLEINKSYNKKSLTAPVASIVMKGKKLLPKYSAYRLVDNRYRKNKPEKVKTQEKT